MASLALANYKNLLISEQREIAGKFFSSFTLKREGIISFTLSVCSLCNHIQQDKQFTNYCNIVHSLEIILPAPYLYKPPIEFNDLGLPAHQNIFSSADVCKLLKIRQDTFRARVNAGMYPKATHFIRGYWRFTEKEIKNILRLTEQLKLQGKISR